MANEEQYYNPIIQAMIASAQKDTQNKKLEQDKERQKQEIESQKRSDTARDRNLDLVERHYEQQAEHEKGMLDIQHRLAEAHIDSSRLGNLKDAYNLSVLLPHLNESVRSLGGKEIEGLPSQEEAQASEVTRFRNQAQATSEGTHAGAAPFISAQSEQSHNQKLEESLQSHAQKMLENEQQGANAQSLAKIHGGYQQSVAHINGANHLRGIALMHQLGLDDGSGGNANQARDLLDGIYNGTTDYKGLTQDQKRAVNSYATANAEEKGLPTDTKKYGASLDNLGKMQTFVDQFRDLANNYSRDSKGAYDKGNQNVNLPIIGTLHRTEPGSDLESRLDSLKTIGGALSKYFEGQSRSADADIIRQATGAFNPKATKEQNLQKLENHIQQLQSAVKNTFVGMTPDRINKVLGDRGITDFGAFKDKTAINPTNGHKIVSHDDGKTWLDAVTKQPFEAK